MRDANGYGLPTPNPDTNPSGGIGNIPGAVLGGFLIGITETMVAGYLSSTYKDAVAFAILILILLFRPSGLLGSTVQEKV